MPIFLLSVSMGGIVYVSIRALSIHPFTQLWMGIFIGVLYYVLLALLFKLTEIKELIWLLKK